MSDTGRERRVVLIPVALWLLAFALSIVLMLRTEPVGDGFTRGLNRVGVFFRWQFLAFACAIFAFLSTRRQENLSRGLALLGRVPIYVQCLLGLLGALVVLSAIVFK